MKFRFVCLAAPAVFFLAAPLGAQPELPRALQPKIKEAAPMINPEAKVIVDGMIARYAALRSYSDTTCVELQGGAALPKEAREGFPVEGKLAWSRPAKLRWEGTTEGKAFLGLSDETTVRAVNPEHPGIYEEHLQNPPQVVTYPDGHTETLAPEPRAFRLDVAVFDSGGWTSGLNDMTGPQSWQRTLKDVRVVALEPDAVTDGEACHVVNIQTEDDQGYSAVEHLYIAKSDGLQRRLEVTFTGRGASKLVETHSDVRINPILPASTWAFEAPTGSKKVETFALPFDPSKNLAVKVGDALPAFSGDALDGKPLELNAKDGKVTMLAFFTLDMALSDVPKLKRYQKALAAKGLRVIGVVGASRRERIERFALDNKIEFPLYFDEGGMENRVAQMFGVRYWSTVLLFGRDGKLQTVSGYVGGPEFLDGMKKLFPGEKIEELLFDPNDFNPPPLPAK